MSRWTSSVVSPMSSYFSGISAVAAFQLSLSVNLHLPPLRDVRMPEKVEQRCTQIVVTEIALDSSQIVRALEQRESVHLPRRVRAERSWKPGSPRSCCVCAAESAAIIRPVRFGVRADVVRELSGRFRRRRVYDPPPVAGLLFGYRSPGTCPVCQGYSIADTKPRLQHDVPDLPLVGPQLTQICMVLR